LLNRSIELSGEGSQGIKRGRVSNSPVIEISDRQLKLSNLDKVLYPATGFTKGQVIDYYARIGPVLVPHLKGRPLTLKRYPNGVDSQFFFEKNATAHRPEWVKTAPIWSEGNQRTVNYILADDLSTLVWMANLAAIELHPSLSMAEPIECPTMMVFDLDPGPPANIVQCAQVGMWLREIFEHFGLQSFPKTSGSKGLQIYVPLNTAVTYETTKPFAHALARLLEDQHRDLVVSDMKKELRKGKVLVDWSQNDQHKTTIAVYSLRARERPTVSTPVRWEEVEQMLKKKNANLLVFEADDVLKRVEKMGDLFEPALTLKQKLPKMGVNDQSSIQPAAAGAGSGRMPGKAHGQSVAEPKTSKKRLDVAAQAGGSKNIVKGATRKATPGKKRRNI
jgi:bifunctional non-homologous end joining protein LigD